MNLFDLKQSNNFLQNNRITIDDLRLYPDKGYMISEIQSLLRYSNENVRYRFMNHLGQEISPN